jgi:hypothetical protein
VRAVFFFFAELTSFPLADILQANGIVPLPPRIIGPVSAEPEIEPEPERSPTPDADLEKLRLLRVGCLIFVVIIYESQFNPCAGGT